MKASTMAKTNDYLIEIMHFPRIIAAKAKGEALECIKLANELKILSVNNKLNCVWFHVSNENPVARKFIHWAKLQKAIGLMKGAPDYVFLWEKGAACIEMKALSGRLSDSQKVFQAWCQQQKVPYKVTYSAEEALNQLKEWNLLT